MNELPIYTTKDQERIAELEQQLSEARRDSDRLDAIGKHGLQIVEHQSLIEDEWRAFWAVGYDFGKMAVSQCLRTSIDVAVLDIEASAGHKH